MSSHLILYALKCFAKLRWPTVELNRSSCRHRPISADLSFGPNVKTGKLLGCRWAVEIACSQIEYLNHASKIKVLKLPTLPHNSSE